MKSFRREPWFETPTRGALYFGPWEQLFHAKFDGRRRKRVLVKIIGD